MVAKLVVFICLCVYVAYVQSGDCVGARYLDPLPPPSYSDVLFPLPSSFSNGKDTYSVSSSQFSFSTASKSQLLSWAFDRYKSLIFGKSIAVAPHFASNPDFSGEVHPHFKFQTSNVEVFESLVIHVLSSDETLQYGVDESYTLNVTAPHGLLQAKTVYGAMRGLETFAQLVTSNSSFSGLTISGAPWIIADTPRYKHRGILIDTSRHYLNISSILRTIDGISYSKMNVLHWHLTDAQSFPFVSQSYPKLSNGRFSAKEVYTTEDLKSVVAYAAHRGVRVVVELDTPGHVASWGVGYPEITVCRDKTRQQGYCAENPCGQIDPSEPLSLEIVHGLVQELTQIFPDGFFHFGSDEIVLDCWNTSKILAWMGQQKLSNFTSVLNYWESQIHQIGAKFGRTPLNWEEVFTAGVSLPPNAVIQIWSNFDTLASVVKAGYRAIVSNYNAWYLDCGFGTWCPYCTWLDAYNNEPTAGSDLTPAEEALILGGEAGLWSEMVTDRNIDSRLWPRAAAVAERLWSAKNVTNTGDAFKRILKHTCRLAARGLDADALIPGSNPLSCASVQE
eukprot:Phypoly_transcript_04829.p1 GENE.Phypoly_transcript_04829~~Phypoly_transcript_04829.p1  ORF type:complete len:561 (+),score=61.11 Phypoly_transcript_04829:52-1734(+)